MKWPSFAVPVGALVLLRYALEGNALAVPEGRWIAFGGPTERGMSGAVWSFGHDDSTLVAGGEFGFAGGQAAPCVARWDGSNWQPLGLGLAIGSPPCADGACDAYVSDLIVDTTGIIACGRFTKSGRFGPPGLNYIAKWNGVAWQPFGSGMNDIVYEIEWYRGQLVATGRFTMAGGRQVDHIARWDGTQWLPLGDGLNRPGRHLIVCQDRLFVSGYFELAGGVPALNLASWDGATWNSVGGAIGNVGPALGVYRDRLVTTILEMPGERVAVEQWDGATWAPLSTVRQPYAMAYTSYDSALVVGGIFSSSGGLGNNIAAWNDTTWAPLGAGVANGHVGALIEHAGALWVGGGFTEAGGQPSYRIARWESKTTPVAVQSLFASQSGVSVTLSWSLDVATRCSLPHYSAQPRHTTERC